MGQKKVEWGPIAEKGRESFENFLILFKESVQDDPRWRVEIIPVEMGGNRLKAYYCDSKASSSVASCGIEITASMKSPFPSSGSLFMQGNEAWVFNYSDKVVTEVAGVLTGLFEMAGIKPVPHLGKGKDGRASHWSIIWNLYPESHPRIQGNP